MELRASPSRDRSMPSYVIATTGGAGSDFLQLNFQPGWTLKRRAYGEKNLGHIYIYRDAAAACSSKNQWKHLFPLLLAISTLERDARCNR